MIPPGAKQIIQVIITNRCDLLKCSNCTQMLMHQSDRFWMTVENFRLAVRSLADWHGVIGVFGGNPCLHPQFSELCRVFCEEIPDKSRRGLWSNNVNGHGKLCKETFGYFNLNVHTNGAHAAEMQAAGLPVIGRSVENQSMHSPTLVAIKDLVPNEAEMWALIEKCDVNIRWSGAITERRGQLRAYFCEIAAAFENVYDEDHGLPVVPGWWRQGIDAFDAQVKRWCVNCGIPLKMRGHADLAFTDDVSKTHVGLTVKGKRPAVLHDSIHDPVAETTDYMRLRT